MRKIVYKCTCNGRVNKDQSSMIHTHNMYETDVDADGICLYCRHFAFAEVEGQEKQRRSSKDKNRRGEIMDDDSCLEEYSVGIKGFRY